MINYKGIVGNMSVLIPKPGGDGIVIINNVSGVKQRTIEDCLHFILISASNANVCNTLHIHLPVVPISITEKTIVTLFKLLNSKYYDMNKLPNAIIIHQPKVGRGKKDSHLITDIISYYKLHTDAVRIIIDGSYSVTYAMDDKYKLNVYYNYSDLDNYNQYHYFGGMNVTYSNGIIQCTTTFNTVRVFGEDNMIKLYCEGE